MLVALALVVGACKEPYPDDLDEQLASFSDSQARREAILEANGIVPPDDEGDVAAPVDVGEGPAAGGSSDDAAVDGGDLTDSQRALRDGGIVEVALPDESALGDGWWATEFDPAADIDDFVASYGALSSCRTLVELTETSRHRALAGAWYGDERADTNVQMWTRLFDTPAQAASWFAVESSGPAMTCVRNAYLVAYQIDEAEIEGLVYDDVVFTRAELGIAVDADVEVAVWRADTPARIEGEIHWVDSVAEVRILIDRMVVAMRVFTSDAVETAVLVDTVVPLSVEHARRALAGESSV